MSIRARVGFWRDVVLRDAERLTAYGRAAPRWCERIWVDPADCDRIVMGFHDHDSGTVVDGDWDLQGEPLQDSPQIRFSRMHWERGVPWEDTGAYAYLLGMIQRRGTAVDGCRDLDDVVRRYDALDRTFEIVRSKGRLRTQTELPGRSFRERGGVVMHIDRDGRPVFGCKGHHRLAMAQILGHPVMPAQVGVVHPAAIGFWRARLAEGVRPERTTAAPAGLTTA